MGARYAYRLGRARRAARAGVVVVATVALAVAGCGGGGPGGDRPDGDGRSGPAASGRPDPSAGRPTAPPTPGPGLHALTLDWQGGDREVLLEAPDGYRPGGAPMPLVLVLHGAPSDPERARERSRLAPVAAEHGFLVAYPEGYLRRWRAHPDIDPVDDLGFLTALVDHLVDEWHAAPDRVYAAGYSNGAAMAYRLAAEAADVFAAVAPVSGVLVEPPGPDEPAAPVSVIGFVGQNDADVVDSGSLDTWRDHLGCAPGEPTTVDDRERVTRIRASCPDGSEVVEYRLASTGHVWPNRDQHGLATSEVIWEFFADHARAG